MIAIDIALNLAVPVALATAIGIAFGFLLGFANRRLRASPDPTVDRIDALLPQTQCAQCGYPGCRPYAEAIAQGEAINKCPPGGEATLGRLADLLGREAVALDASAGAEQPRRVAFILEDECIGCARCLAACPVDAIVGAHQFMHTVIPEACTGCDLCLEPCPVDCIEMRPLETRRAKPLLTDDALACINCGDCVDACPVGLMPQTLYRIARAEELSKLEPWRLDACIECGNCDRACPSHIPLVANFKWAKDALEDERENEARAARAKQRHAQRLTRLEGNERERQERRQLRLDALRTGSTPSAPVKR